MARKHKHRRKSAPTPPPPPARRRPGRLPWAAIAAAAALLLGLSAIGPERLSGLFSRAAPAQSSARSPSGAPFRLTILHTNDTWGFVLPCG